jgi:hypothetical protein
MKRDRTRPQENERTPAGGVVKHVVLRTSLGVAARLSVPDWILKWRHKHRPGPKPKVDDSAVQNYVDNWMRRAGHKWGDRKRAVRAAMARFGFSKRTIEEALRQTKTGSRPKN